MQTSRCTTRRRLGLLICYFLISSTTQPVLAQISSQTNVTASYDFEEGFGNWFADNGVWQVGAPAASPDSSHSSDMVAGTVLSGMYPPRAQSRLVSPPIALPDSIALQGNSLQLTFKHWYTFNSQDEGRLQISVEGADWSDFPDLDPLTGTNHGWKGSPSLDLTRYAGQEIKIAFLFTSSDANVELGWYIDDVFIQEIPPRVFDGNEDFSDPVRDWTVEGGSWEFGTPNGAGHPAFAQNGIAATVLNGIYANESGRLISPELVIPSDSLAGRLRVRFDHQFDFAPGDTGFVQLSVNNGAWQNLGAGFHGFSGPWTQYVATHLPAQLVEGDRIRFAFLLAIGSNAASHNGWRIDNVSISTIMTGIYGPFDADSSITERIGPEAHSPEAGIEWFSDNGLWEVGTPASGPGSGYKDSLAAGTNLNGAYTNGAYSRFVSPPLQITDASFGLSFWHWFDFEPGDYGIVQISVNYGKWIDLSSQPFTFSSGGWSFYQIFDVAGEIAGQVNESEITGGTIRIGFLFTSQQTGNTRAGWYLDDIELKGLLFTSNEYDEQPRTATLDQNFPNPFNPSTTIGFTIEASERVSLKIYDLLGREVATLLDSEFLTAGAHNYTWHAGRQASGVYLYKLETATSTMIRRMHLVK